MSKKILFGLIYAVIFFAAYTLMGFVFTGTVNLKHSLIFAIMAGVINGVIWGVVDAMKKNKNKDDDKQE